jgi:hypothetical protein
MHYYLLFHCCYTFYLINRELGCLTSQNTMSPSIKSVDARNGSAPRWVINRSLEWPLLTLSYSYSEMICSDSHYGPETRRESSSPKPFNLPLICQDYITSESLEIYLKDTTVLVPAYGRLFDPKSYPGLSKINMQAILNKFIV